MGQPRGINITANGPVTSNQPPRVCVCEPEVCVCVLTSIFSLPPSESFDYQFGAVILRLKEGLDVSHIQGQGNTHTHTHTHTQSNW